MKIFVRIKAGAKKSEFIETLTDDSGALIFKIAIKAPATEGKANAALIRFLAKSFDLTQKEITITSGKSSTNKVILLNTETPPKELVKWQKL